MRASRSLNASVDSLLTDMSEEDTAKKMDDVSQGEKEIPSEDTSSREKMATGSETLKNPVADIPSAQSAGIDVAEKLLKRVDGFINEIDELATKDIDVAQSGYIVQGRFVVRAKEVVNSLQNSAYRSTMNCACSLASATFSKERAAEVKSALKIGKIKPFENVVSSIEGHIKEGLKHSICFNTLCDRTESFCIKIEKVCSNETNEIRNLMSQSRIATLNKFAIIVGIVVAIVAVILSVEKPFELNTVFQMAVAIIIIAGLVIYAVSRILASKRATCVHNDTITSLVRTKKAVLALRAIVNEFKITQRSMLRDADDALRQIQQFKAKEEQTDASDMEESVSIFWGKCQQLHESVEEYKDSIKPVIQRLDDLDLNFC